MFGSVIAVSAPLITGGTATPSEASAVWFSRLVRKRTKSIASGGALLPIAKPSPPPSTSEGSPAPPSTAGKGKKPRSSPSPSPLSEQRLLVARRPVAHQLHRGLAVGEQRLGGVVGLAEEAILERFEVDQLLQHAPAWTNGGSAKEPSRV